MIESILGSGYSPLLGSFCQMKVVVSNFNKYYTCRSFMYSSKIDPDCIAKNLLDSNSYDV